MKLTEEKRYWNFCLLLFLAEVRLDVLGMCITQALRVLLSPDQKTPVKRRGGYKVRLTICIYKHLDSLQDTSSQIFDLYWKPCQTLFLSL